MNPPKIARAIVALSTSPTDILEMCEKAARANRLVAGTPAFKQCMWPTGPADPSLPANVRRALQIQWQRPGAWADMIYNAQSSDRSSAEVQQQQRRYGSMPIVVLTSDVRVDMQGMPLKKTLLERIAAAYQQWDRDIADLSSRGSEVVVVGSSDNMAIDHPSNVATAIDKVLQQVRRPRISRER